MILPLSIYFNPSEVKKKKVAEVFLKIHNKQNIKNASSAHGLPAFRKMPKSNTE